MNDQPVSKKLKLSDPIINCQILVKFKEWLQKEKFELSPKVDISSSGSCARFGVIAVDDILSGDIILCIPRNSILWEKNCSLFASLLDCELKDSSGWVKLILCLMYEYTNKTSRWHPYMQFIPPVTCMDQPMFWTSEQLSFLKGTGVQNTAIDDVRRIEEEYNEIALPFLIKHSHLGFDANIHNLNLYKHMAAFVMAYSFTEPNEDDELSPPMMVPLADVLNHVTENNACLEFEPDRLVMKATCDIQAGFEVYNTYGQLSNAQLLQMYGFVEPFPNNVYDTVDIEVASLFTSAPGVVPCADAKQKWLKNEKNISGDYPVVLGVNGILTVPEFKLIHRILFMSEKEFVPSEWREDEEWESDSDDDDDEEIDQEFEVFSFKKIKQLGSEMKSCLRACAQSRLNDFKESKLRLNERQTDNDANRLEEWRAFRSLALIQGQQRIIELLMDAAEE